MLNLEESWSWLVGSFAVAVAASNAAWWLARRWTTGKPGLAAVLPAASWAAVSLFLLLPPVGAWMAGAVSPYFLGVAELEWVDQLMTGAPLAIAVLAMLLLGWSAYRRSSPAPYTVKPAALEWFGSVARAPLDAGLRQWHWTFYRAVCTGWLAAPDHPLLQTAGRGLAEQPLYWGAFLGLGIAAVEWVFNPWVRAAWRMPGRDAVLVREAVLAVATTALFAATRNFWICLVCHMTAGTIITAWDPAQVKRVTGE